MAPWYRARTPPRRRGTAAPTRTERVRSAAPNLLLSQHQRTRRYGVPSPGNADIPRRRRRFEKPTANERRVNAPRSVSANHVISPARAAMAANGIRAGQDLGLSWIYLLAQRISRQIMLAPSATPGIDGKFVVVRLRRFQSCRGTTLDLLKQGAQPCYFDVAFRRIPELAPPPASTGVRRHRSYQCQPIYEDGQFIDASETDLTMGPHA